MGTTEDVDSAVPTASSVFAGAHSSLISHLCYARRCCRGCYLTPTPLPQTATAPIYFVVVRPITRVISSQSLAMDVLGLIREKTRCQKCKN